MLELIKEDANPRRAPLAVRLPDKVEALGDRQPRRGARRAIFLANHCALPAGCRGQGLRGVATPLEDRQASMALALFAVIGRTLARKCRCACHMS